MEQVVIYDKNGIEKRSLFSYNNLCSVLNAEQKTVLLGEDTVNMTIATINPVDLTIGDYIIVYGKVYTLNTIPEPTKKSEHNFEYSLIFEGAQYKLIDKQYRNTDAQGKNSTGSFDLTGDISLAMNVLINCMNKDSDISGETWLLGYCPETEYLNLTFSDENCLAVLQRLCGEEIFNTEFEIEALPTKNYKLHIRKVGKIFPDAFTFGKGGGIYELKRKNVDSKNIITRLYVEGGSRNITSKYRDGALRLRLPGESYIQQEKPVQAVGIKEGGKKFDDVYPSRIGVVSDLGEDIYSFVDNEMFDLNEKDENGTKWLQDGISAKIKFVEGFVSGYELEINKFDSKTKTFKVNPYEDSRGLKITNESPAYQIAKGDKYVLLDIVMPDDPYVIEAEAKLLEKGTKYYEQNSQPRVQYELLINSMYLQRKYGRNGVIVNVFNVGDYITVKDDDINVDKAIRIKDFTRNVIGGDYEYKVTLSDIVDITIIEKIIADNVEQDKINEINNLTDIGKARSNWRTTQELVNMVFDSDGKFDPINIRANSIETLMLSVGNRAGQFIIKNVTFIANSVFNNITNPNYFTVLSDNGVIAHYALLPVDITWQVSPVSFTLTDSGAYYLYAKCPKVSVSDDQKEPVNGGYCEIFASQDKYNVEDANNNLYYLPIGIISSINNNYREVTTTYGATRITGRDINCGRIESVDKRTYFDLDNSEIGGNIKFTSNSGDLIDVPELMELIKAITDNYTQIIGGLILSTYLKLGAKQNNDKWVESAGLKAMFDNPDEIAAYFGGTYEEALALKEAMTIIYHNGKLRSKNAEITGIIHATDGDFSGSLHGVVGTFKRLQAINEKGEIVAEIVFDAEKGYLLFNGDIENLGINNNNQKGYRLKTNHLWCNGGFGSAYKTTLVITGDTANVYNYGLDNNKSETIYLRYGFDNQIQYYNLDLVLYSGYSMDMPIDIIYFSIEGSSRDIYYCLRGKTGKKVMLINYSSPVIKVYIYINGNKTLLANGEITEYICLSSLKSGDRNILGHGWTCTAKYKN